MTIVLGHYGLYMVGLSSRAVCARSLVFRMVMLRARGSLKAGASWKLMRSWPADTGSEVHSKEFGFYTTWIKKGFGGFKQKCDMIGFTFQEDCHNFLGSKDKGRKREREGQSGVCCDRTVRGDVSPDERLFIPPSVLANTSLQQPSTFLPYILHPFHSFPFLFSLCILVCPTK